MKTANGLPLESVRGQVRAWIERHAEKLGNRVLEIGSRMHAEDAWWIVNRDLARGEWLGIDMQAGPGVDECVDIQDLPGHLFHRFTGVLCSEVLEHVARPWAAARSIKAALVPGGCAVVTVPACFPQHNFPDDYWRFTESGLRELLEYAGFTDIETANGGNVNFSLNDHGESGMCKRQTPMHTFAIARA